MDIILHAGAHCTDEDRLLKCMLRNTDDFRKRGIEVPGPSRYRQLLREAVNSLGENLAGPDARGVLLDGILDDDIEHVGRLFLSNPHFFSVPKIALSRGYVYPMAVKRLHAFQSLFAGDKVELFLALRNPATWLPAMFAATPHRSFEAFLNGTGVFEFRWSELISRMRTQVPGIEITVWCNEDTPLIWGQVIREAAGMEPNEKVIGSFDILAEIMSKEGMQRFRGYLHEHPVMTEMQKRRVMAAFLDKFALDDEIEEELDLPGWSEELVDGLTEIYEEDIFALERIPGVNFIAP